SWVSSSAVWVSRPRSEKYRVSRANSAVASAAKASLARVERKASTASFSVFALAIAVKRSTDGCGRNLSARHLPDCGGTPLRPILLKFTRKRQARKRVAHLPIQTKSAVWLRKAILDSCQTAWQMVAFSQTFHIV